MIKYYLYEKIRDKYVIQNIETKEIELVSEKEVIEGKEYGLIQEYDLRHLITRKLVVKDELIFESDRYKISYNKKHDNVVIDINDYVVLDNLILYIPFNINKLLFEEPYTFTIKNVMIVASGLTEVSQLSKIKCNILNLEYLITDKIYAMHGLFYNMIVKKIVFGDFKTGHIKSMRAMFRGCNELEELDLSSFDTSNVKDMKDMFAGCKSLAKLNISTFDTSNVIYMSSMFFDCYNLEFLDLSNFNLLKVVDISNMFYYCTNLREINFGNRILNNCNIRCYDFLSGNVCLKTIRCCKEFVEQFKVDKIEYKKLKEVCDIIDEK